jgi:hypothetical protein
MIAIVFMIDAHAFPSIFLIIQFQCRTRRIHDLKFSSIWRDSIQLAEAVSAKECNVLQLELLCLRRSSVLLPPTLVRVFSHLPLATGNKMQS